MNEQDKIEMLEKENQMLKAELRGALDELSTYKDRFGNLSDTKQGGKGMDLKKILNESKDKIQDKLNEDKFKDKVDKSKEISDKAKKKMLEGSAIAVDVFKSAKKVLFNKELKENFKEELEQRRKERTESDEKKD